MRSSLVETDQGVFIFTAASIVTVSELYSGKTSCQSSALTRSARRSKHSLAAGKWRTSWTLVIIVVIVITVVIVIAVAINVV